MKFALFFMAEYTKMIAISAIAATLYFGGYIGPFVDQFPLLGPVYLVLKVIVLLFFMVWVRATLPRIRYDRLMALGWKVLLPLSLAISFVSAVGVILAQDVDPRLIWTVPVVSTVIGLLVIGLVDRSLRRKAYAVR
jgi:NADH-quinone oxidoreductase subunit H